MSIYWDEKVFLLGIEASYGVAPVLAAANAILATNIRLSPMEGEDVSRNLELPDMGAQGTIPVNLHSKLTFTVELLGSGTRGTAPVIGKLLRICAMAEVIVAGASVTYTPVSRGHESGAVHLWIGDTRYALTGTRGTATLRVNASGIPVVEFELTGLFVMPSEVAPVVPDLEDQLDAEVLAASTTNTPVFTIGTTPFVMRSFSLALGNRVETRFLVGAESVLITGRSEMIETTVEAKPLTAFNPFQLARARTKQAVVLTHGTVAGQTVTVRADRAQMQRPAGLEGQQGVKEWPLRLVPQRVSRNDQISIAFT